VSIRTESEARYLYVPPSNCTQAADRLGWEDTRTYRAGPWDLGIRANTKATSQIVQRLLPDIARPELRGASANLSVAFDDNLLSRGTPEVMQLLFLKCKPVLKTRNPRRVLEALLAWLDSFEHESRTDYVVIESVALIHEQQAFLVTPGLTRAVGAARRRLSQAGFVAVDGPTLLLDTARGEIVVEPPATAHDRSVLAEVARDVDPSDRAAAVGRYPVEAVLTRLHQPAGMRLGPARGVYGLGMNVFNRHALGPQGALDRLATFAQQVPILAGGVRDEVVDRVVAMAGGSAPAHTTE